MEMEEWMGDLGLFGGLLGQSCHGPAHMLDRAAKIHAVPC